MAGAGYKLFNTGDVLTAAQVNTYLQEQTVMVFADSAARTTALSGVLAEGMMSYLQDTNAVEVYNGSNWVGVGNVGDITEVQAGVGISVASGTGPIPVITNSSTDLITTAGDLLYGTAADTVARLGIGTAGHVLKVNSGATAPEWAVDPTTDVVTTAGDLLYATAADTVTRLGIGTAGQVLKVNSGATAPEWGTAAGGGDLVRITTSTFSAVAAANVDSVFSSTYQNYLILMAINSSSGSNAMNLRFRTSGTTNTTSNYGSNWEYAAFGTGGATGQLGSAAASDIAYISDITGGGAYYAMTIFNPHASERTLAVYTGVQTNGYRATGALQFATTTSFDGISFISAAGDITGNISVYGYKNS